MVEVLWSLVPASGVGWTYSVGTPIGFRERQYWGNGWKGLRWRAATLLPTFQLLTWIERDKKATVFPWLQDFAVSTLCFVRIGLRRI